MQQRQRDEHSVSYGYEAPLNQTGSLFAKERQENFLHGEPNDEVGTSPSHGACRQLKK